MRVLLIPVLHPATDMPCCLQEWTQLPEPRRNVVRSYGWVYFQMPVWGPARHCDFPEHLRVQVVAVAMAVDWLLPEGRGGIMLHIANALDAWKRVTEFGLLHPSDMWG